jgi:hypothetical protein
MPAAEADDPDVGSGSHHLPAVAAARVNLFQLYDITLFYFHYHDIAF